MILLDTGPLVAAFDPSDENHASCVRALRTLDAHLVTTNPVLTEAFHLLSRSRRGPSRLSDYLLDGPVAVRPLRERDLRRSLQLMSQYWDTPMDFADASLVAIGERSGIDRVFTMDRRHFATYRMRRGYRHASFTMIGPDGPEPLGVRERPAPYEIGALVEPEAGAPSPNDGTSESGQHDDAIAASALREAREALDRLQQALGA